MKKRIMSALVAMLLLCSCAGENKNPAETTAPPKNEVSVGTASELSKSTTDATADFATDLFQAVYTSGENCLISPLSVTFALAMTEMGAAGDTLAQMADVISGGMDRDVFVGEIASLKKDFDRYSGIHIANGVWYKDGFLTPYESFVRACEEKFGAPLTASPFDSSTVTEINSWVKEHTSGRIENMIDELGKDSVMCLVNALTFDGVWKEPCNERSVAPLIFKNGDGTAVTVDGMSFFEDRYITVDGGEGFIKPYTDNRFAFMALLPDEGTDLADFISGLTGEEIVNAVSSTERKFADVVLPKFSADFDTELNEPLKKMGMTVPFDRNAADFSEFGTINDPTVARLFISRVIHKTFIKVDEAGTEAAASTAVILDKTMGIIDGDVKQVILDRPFVYMIVDTDTGLPLFMGAMENMG